MKAVVLRKPHDIIIEEREVPSPGPNEVVVKVMYVGYCGTDVMVWAGSHRAKYPVIPGHEFVGRIHAIGDSVTGLQVGDTVVPEASYPCGTCRMCNRGLEEYCRNRVSLGRTRDGAMAEFVTIPARIVHKINKKVDLIEAQSLVGIACAVHAVLRSKVGVGSKVLIVGSGHSALLLLQVVKAAGATGIALLGGSRELRLSLAKMLGADLVVSTRDPNCDQILSSFVEDDFDIVVEASGQPESLNKAITFIRPGGIITIFSTYPRPVHEMVAQEFYYKEIILKGSKSGQGGYEIATELLSSGRVKVRPMITHEVTIEEAQHGFELMESRDESVFRVVMKIAD